jgi:hypothetical protein
VHQKRLTDVAGACLTGRFHRSALVAGAAVKDANPSAPNRFLSAGGCDIEAHSWQDNGFLRWPQTRNPS